MKKLQFSIFFYLLFLSQSSHAQMVNVNRWVSPVFGDFTTIPENMSTDAALISWGYTGKLFQYQGYLTRPAGDNVTAVNRWEMGSCREFIILAEHEIPDATLLSWGYKNKQFLFYAHRTRPTTGRYVAVSRWINTKSQGDNCRDFTLSISEHELTDAQLTNGGYTNKLVQFYVPDPRSSTLSSLATNIGTGIAAMQTDVTGTWQSADGWKAEYFQSGTAVYAILNVGNFKHFVSGNRNGNQIQGQITRVDLNNNCRTLMNGTWTLNGNNSMQVTWTDLDGNCDLQRGQRGTDAPITRTTRPTVSPMNGFGGTSFNPSSDVTGSWGEGGSSYGDWMQDNASVYFIANGNGFKQYFQGTRSGNQINGTMIRYSPNGCRTIMSITYTQTNANTMQYTWRASDGNCDLRLGQTASGTITRAGSNGSNNTDTRRMTRFDPPVHGFKFANTFDNNGFVAGIRLNFSGLCGGMSYSALDYYFRNTPIPQTDVKPNEGTQLTEYIRSRQWKTFENQADKWAELAATNWLGLRTSEFWNWGVQGFNGGRLQELRSQIDKGNPAILGLFAAGSGGFSSEHHQVIAIGYDMGRYRGDLGANKDDLKIFICDPNYPNQIMVLKPSESRQRYYYELTDINKTTLKQEEIEEIQKREWLTYFVDLNYVTTTPLDPNVINRCSNVNFENQNMSGQTHNRKAYRCAKATGVNFRGATISGTDFGSSTFRSAIFYGANCTNTNFAQSNLDNADFYGADLRNCNFSNTDLKSVRFYGADLKSVTMMSANAQDANFEGADLHQGKFNSTSFRNARLFKTSFNTTDCRNADFSGANLTGADFRNANISEANFTGAITTGIQLQGAIRTGTIGL